MSKLNKKQKILVAMSGGVDSSVAAALLVKAGHDVTGAFMVNYGASLSELRPTSSGDKFTGRSVAETCWTGDYQDALRVAAKLGIPLMRLDFRKEYKKTVLDYMYDEYRKGRTPNPDVLCNKFVKFGAWLDKAKKLGFDKLATGHYARLGREIRNPKSEIRNKSQYLISNIKLLAAKDANKDQTYFLHQLTQEQLRFVLFPIGDYTKPEVRKLAKKFNLPNADKEESMGICFVGEVPMKEFLLKKIKPKPGKIILSTYASATPTTPPLGKRGTPTVIGEHDGLPFYTIGQRQGLSFRAQSRNPLNMVIENSKDKGSLHSAKSLGRDDNTKPLYVLAKNFSKNELIVGYEDDPLLYKKEVEVADINWITQNPKFPLNCEVRLRHRQPLQKCVIRLLTLDSSRLSKVQSPKSKVLVQFSKLQRAVTPGQFAVFYAKGECLGGGVIN